MGCVYHPFILIKSSIKPIMLALTLFFFFEKVILMVFPVALLSAGIGLQELICYEFSVQKFHAPDKILLVATSILYT